jgi:hypothetical protein
MTWRPREIDWLALSDEKEFARAIADLLSSNPVLSGAINRPTGHRNLNELYRDVSLVAQGEMESVLLNPKTYYSSSLVQMSVVDGVNKYLVIRHYLFRLLHCRPKPPHCPIFAGQVWFLASYLIVKGKEVFDWKSGAPLWAFYNDLTTFKGRRPSITLSEDNDGLYSMVPCSHSPGGKSVKVDLDNSNSYACCYFVFRASWVMLYGDKGAANNRRMSLRSSDFNQIKLMTRQISP